MRKTVIAALAAALVPALATGARGQARELPEAVAKYVAVDAPLVALTNVRVVDGTGAAPLEGATVVMRDGSIAAVGPAGSVAVPAGAEVLDLPGHTVIPGIVGLHDHTFYTTSSRRVQLGETAPKLYLGAGVTTIRTTGSYHPYTELNLKRAVEAGEIPGPRVHVTGPYLTGGTSSYMTILNDPDQARRVVAYWADEGATWFKVYTRVSRADLAAVIEEAHARGLKVTGHICSVSFREAVELGIDNLEHGFFTNTDYVPDKRPDECPDDFRTVLARVEIDGPEVGETFRAMIENGVPLSSTLAIYEAYVPGRPHLEERQMALMAPEVAAEVRAAHEEIEANAEGSLWPVLWEKALAFEKAFVEAGGLLGAGVDPTGYGSALPGLGDQRNLELLVEAGFTPVEAIQIMTANGAKILGEYDRYGSIEPGKLAELVVIEGNPVTDPAEIRNVRYVFKDGLGYDSAKLIESTKGIVGIR